MKHSTGRRKTDQLLAVRDVDVQVSCTVISSTSGAIDNQAVAVVIERRVAQRDRGASHSMTRRATTDRQQNHRTRTGSRASRI